MSPHITEKARAAHEQAVADGAMNYTDPDTGLTVFTSLALTLQGRCCGSGCRHCPYDEEEQRRGGRPTSR